MLAGSRMRSLSQPACAARVDDENPRMLATEAFVHPCLRCGACCAHYRVGLHWSETAPELGGRVPAELTEPLRQHERAMRGTSQAKPRCIALDADIGTYSRCTIHASRPAACAALTASWEQGEAIAQCDRARIAYGLPALTPADWPR